MCRATSNSIVHKELLMTGMVTSHIDSKAYSSMSTATTLMYPIDPWAFPITVFALVVFFILLVIFPYQSLFSGADAEK
jgi:hypothetical protein